MELLFGNMIFESTSVCEIFSQILCPGSQEVAYEVTIYDVVIGYSNLCLATLIRKHFYHLAKCMLRIRLRTMLRRNSD